MARAETHIFLNRDEVNANIPYALICEVRYGCSWDLSKVKKRWISEFTEAERNKANKMFRQSHMWYLSTGVPDEVEMTASEFALWIKLGAFCGSI